MAALPILQAKAVTYGLGFYENLVTTLILYLDNEFLLSYNIGFTETAKSIKLLLGGEPKRGQRTNFDRENNIDGNNLFQFINSFHLN